VISVDASIIAQCFCIFENYCDPDPFDPTASVGKNSRAKVVFPAPFGPAIMTMRLLCSEVLMLSYLLC